MQSENTNTIQYNNTVIFYVTVVPDWILANSGYSGMLYGFRILRSCGVRVPKLQNRTLASRREIRILSSGKIRIFTGLDFSGLISIPIDGELNFEWKIGLTL